MKKLATSLLLLGAATAVHAQTSAGTVLLGGNVGYNSSKDERSSGSFNFEETRKEFRFLPTAGYFIFDNLAVGLTGGIQTAKLVQPYRDYSQGSYSPVYDRNFTSSSVNVGPFVRYYKMISEKAGFYGQLAGGFLSGRSETESDAPFFESDNIKLRGSYVTLTPGFVFFPAPKLGLELTLGNLGYSNFKNTYSATRQGQEYEVQSSSVGASLGLQYLNVGASFYLGGK